MGARFKDKSGIDLAHRVQTKETLSEDVQKWGWKGKGPQKTGDRPGRLRNTEEEQEFKLSWRGQEGKSARHGGMRIMEGLLLSERDDESSSLKG